jgi:hypothetical protein
VWVIDLLVNFPSPHLGAPTCPFTPEVLRAKQRTLIPSSFVVFTFGLIVKSIKELGGASLGSSFDQNLCYKYPNESCEPILNIYVPKAFQ